MTISFLIGKLICNKHEEKIQPETVLFIRGIFATIATYAVVNTRIRDVLYVPYENRKPLVIRSL